MRSPQVAHVNCSAYLRQPLALGSYHTREIFRADRLLAGRTCFVLVKLEGRSQEVVANNSIKQRGIGAQSVEGTARLRDRRYKVLKGSNGERFAQSLDVCRRNRLKRYDLRWPMDKGMTLKGDGETGWYVEDEAGTKSFPAEEVIGQRLSTEHRAVDFDVLYIGQAFGDDGSRHALDRLKKHETLQKIAVKGIPDGYNLTILMLAIEPGNQLITIFNPWAKDTSQGSDRINRGLDKLFNTNEAERTTLYEASLIRYFQPPFNKEFKNSFPSTNMKVLADCYDKDISAVAAEICIDQLPFWLFSATVERKPNHVAKHDLHTDAARQVFFT